MPGRDTKYQQMAREMAERLADDRDRVQQLSLLPDEVAGAALVEDGRAKRGQGKVLNQMREFLAAKGYRMPEDVLAEIAGLTSGQDAIATAMAQSERVLAWAKAGHEAEKGIDGKKIKPRVTMHNRLATFQQVLVAQLRAADALMPYGAPKATPDGDGGPKVMIVTLPAAPSGQAFGGAAMRDVSPASSGRMRPADVRYEIEQKQRLSDDADAGSDGETRTEGPSR